MVDPNTGISSPEGNTNPVEEVFVVLGELDLVEGVANVPDCPCERPSRLSATKGMQFIPAERQLSRLARSFQPTPS